MVSTVPGKRIEQSPHDQTAVALVGALLLSAVGSLPLHLVPIIIVTLIADGRLGTSEAGWVASAILFGQLLTSLALPIFGIVTVRCLPATGISLLLMLGLWMTAVDQATALFAGWFTVGSCAGVLMYLGTNSASHYRNTTFAFSLRLGIVLVLAGGMTAALVLRHSLGSYTSFLTTVSAVFCCLLVVGLFLYRPVLTVARSNTKEVSHHKEGRPLFGFALMFLLFVGQLGFLAYVIQNAIARGMPASEATWAIVAMKITAGVGLFVLALHSKHKRGHDRLLAIGTSLAIVLVMASATNILAVFLVSLLIYEMAFNTLSARFQANLAERDKHLAGRWLTGTILLGAAIGPPMHGAAISADLAIYFLVIAAISAILPGMWVRSRS